jgi:hypothetical protein
LGVGITGLVVSITGDAWFWIVGVGAVVLLLLWASISRAIDAGISRALPDFKRHLTRLEEIGSAADDVHKRVGVLDRWLRAQARSYNTLGTVQTFFGTLIGLLAGFSADWVAEGGLDRIIGAVVVGLALVMGAPRLIVRIFAGRKDPDTGWESAG